MANYVPAIGPTGACIMLIGEAPGAEEDVALEPFVGPAGRCLNELLSRSGVQRAACRITNVVKHRPPNNDISIYYEKTKGGKPSDRPTEGLLHLFDAVRAEVEAVRPNVVVPLGKVALQALTGETAIGSWRGSILESPFIKGQKVIPTYHPSACLPHHQPELSFLVVHDLKRVREESAMPEIVLPERSFIIEPSFSQVMQELTRLQRIARYVSFDIETRGNQIVCLGLSDDPSRAICIPFVNDDGPAYSLEEEASIWRMLGRLWVMDKRFVAQNAMFDCAYLAKQGLWPATGIWHDTMLAEHSLYPEHPKDLGFLASMYTREPYWKDEGRDWRAVRDWRRFWTYCCKDCSVTLEIAFAQEKELKELGVEAVHRHAVGLIEPLLTMTLHGSPVDAGMARGLCLEFLAEVAEAQVILDESAGRPVNAHSPKQLKELIYGEWKLPVQRDRKTKAVTVNEDALKALSVRHPSPAFDAILDIRSKSIFANVCRKTAEADGARLRCSWNIAGTGGGRLSSSESMFGEGMNLQNIPVKDDVRMRKLFVADPGKVLCYSDLAQAEARVVAYLAEELALIDIFNADGDVHARTAAAIFHISEAEVVADEALFEQGESKRYRYRAKRTVHACHDDKTEVLTHEGWIPFSTYMSCPVPVAQWENTVDGHISFVIPTACHSYAFAGFLQHLQAQAYDQAVTPNHRVPYMSNAKHREVVAANINSYLSTRLPICGHYDGGDTQLQDDVVRLIVAVQADGCISYAKTGHIRFRLKKPRKIQRLVGILHRLGIPFKQTVHGDKASSIGFNAPFVLRWLTPGKTFDYRLLDLTGANLDVFLAELHHWDGTLHSGVTTAKREAYISSTRRNVEVVQTIAHLRGRECLVRQGTRAFIGSLNRRRYARCPTPRRQWYQGRVYCVTLPSGGFLVRRNGVISCSLNSNYGMGVGKFAMEVGCSVAEAKVLQNAYFASFPMIRQWQRAIETEVRTTRTLRTPTGRVRQFFGLMNDETFRQAYSYIPQTTVGDIAMTWLKRVYAELGDSVDIYLQVHDALVYAVDEDRVDELVAKVEALSKIPLTLHGRTFVIPCTTHRGKSWGDAH